MKPTTLTALVLLASCTAEPATETTETRAHRTIPTDTTETAPGSISFDMGDTTLTEEEEILYFHAEEWGDQEQDAGL